MKKLIPRSGVLAPQNISLSEANAWFRLPIEALRLAASRARLAMDLPTTLNLGQTAWTLCVSSWTGRKLIRQRKIAGRQVISGTYIVWQIETESVRQFAAERERKYGAKHPFWRRRRL